MAQVSSQWQQLLNRVNALTSTRRAEDARLASTRPWDGWSGWVIGAAIAAGVIHWNWKLPIATGSGILAMLLVYRWQTREWQKQLTELRKSLGGSSQSLTLAVAAGAIVAPGTYLAFALWANTSNHWLALTLILQGIGTLAILSLLIWQVMQHRAQQIQQAVDPALQDLTHPDPMKRLIAVRQLTRHWMQMPPDSLQRSTITDCFQLLLSREQEPLVRNAVLDSLNTISSFPCLRQGRSPLTMPPSNRIAASPTQPLMQSTPATPATSATTIARPEALSSQD